MNKEAILRAFIEEVWNEKRKDLVVTYVHDAYTIHLDTGDHWEGKTLDHKAYKERLDFSFDSFPDMNFEIKSAIEEENHVAITWILTGTNLGKIGDFPPTNKKINTPGMTIYYFNDDLISGHAQVFDRITVMKQLGFIGG
jgi:steroid delta-isomerase-like uncharacterized protein